MYIIIIYNILEDGKILYENMIEHPTNDNFSIYFGGTMVPVSRRRCFSTSYFTIATMILIIYTPGDAMRIPKYIVIKITLTYYTI